MIGTGYGITCAAIERVGGQLIDCIKVAHPAGPLHGHHPSSRRAGFKIVHNASTSLARLLGTTKGACPPGTVPARHISEEAVALAGTLDQFLAKHPSGRRSHHGRSGGSGGLDQELAGNVHSLRAGSRNGDLGHHNRTGALTTVQQPAYAGHEYAIVQHVSSGSSIYGAQAALSVWSPAVETGHSGAPCCLLTSVGDGAPPLLMRTPAPPGATAWPLGLLLLSPPPAIGAPTSSLAGQALAALAVEAASVT
eukprot:SM000254S08795  [mRNA]  locus=s254:85406:87850:+ [translate_table: standard]